MFQHCTGVRVGFYTVYTLVSSDASAHPLSDQVLIQQEMTGKLSKAEVAISLYLLLFCWYIVFLMVHLLLFLQYSVEETMSHDLRSSVQSGTIHLAGSFFPVSYFIRVFHITRSSHSSKCCR